MSTAKKLLSGSAAGADPIYVEDVFATHVFTGNDGSATRTNYLDLATDGGMMWVKNRLTSDAWRVFDTARGNAKYLTLNSTAQEYTGFNQAFTTTGFSFNTDDASVNELGDTYMTHNFKKAEGFFDVFTYNGNSNGSNRTFSHDLNAEIGFAVIKVTNQDGYNWYCMHRQSGSGLTAQYGLFDAINAFANGAIIHSHSTTEVTFSNANGFNQLGQTYVVYLFAHNDSDGGYGPNADQDIIKCGVVTGGSTSTVDLGFEPQWLLTKSVTVNNSWYIFDTHRGFHGPGRGPRVLNPGYLSAEYTESADAVNMTPTGFTFNPNRFNGNATYMYVAIRRAPMKEAESGKDVFDVSKYTSSVFTPYFQNADGSKYMAWISPDDTVFQKQTNGTEAAFAWPVANRLRSLDDITSWTVTTTTSTPALFFHNTDQESTSGTKIGRYPGTTGNGGGNPASSTLIGYDSPNDNVVTGYAFRRSPGFHDVVVYTGSNSADNVVKHNLGVTPEFIITKVMNYNGEDWHVYVNGISNSFILTEAGAVYSNAITAVSSTSMTLANDRKVNWSYNYVAMMWATQAGVSKVGTYTGTGGDITVDCGFTAGARFIIIKPNATGAWYVFNSADGIVAGSDTYVRLNATDTSASADLIDPDNSGFIVTSTGGTTINNSGTVYAFLAVA
tara:strand:+ start:624 stop:2630 length:2007 start_codon:yes stop_codon:yes gene_type:complete